MSYTIRPLAEEDLINLTDIFSSAIGHIDDSIYTKTQKEAWIHGAPQDAHDWKLRLEGLKTLVACESLDCKDQGHEDGPKSRAVAFLSFKETGYIDLLYVHPDHQRQGLATSLLALVKADCLARGQQYLSAHVSHAARPFFERQDFEIKEHCVQVRNGVKIENAWMMSKMKA